MIQQRLKIIRNERNHNIGILIELFLVSVFLWYIVDYAFVVIRNYTRPMNFDIEHTYIMRLGHLNSKSPEYTADADSGGIGEPVFKILDRIGRNPMIEAVSLSIHASPHIGSNRSRTLYNDTLNTKYSILCRSVTPDFFRVFRYKSVNGSTDELADALTKGTYVISQNVENELFPNSSAIGKTFSLSRDEDSEKYRVGAVSTSIRYDHFGTWNAYYASPLTVQSLDNVPPSYIGGLLEVCVRVKPEEDHDFIDRFREQMTEQLRIGNVYLNTIQSIPTNKKAFQLDDVNDLRMRFFIILFLLVNIFLGITGTFWFRTQYRRGEIGVRIAMGDTPRNILRMFYAEGILLLSLAMIPTMIVYAFIKEADILYASWSFDAGRYFIGFAITYILLLGMILLGIWFPAHKAVQVPPAEALRDE